MIEVVLDRVIEIAQRESGLQHLSVESRLSDVFDDSLEFLEFVHCVREEVGYVSDSDVAMANTLGDLVNAFQC